VHPIAVAAKMANTIDPMITDLVVMIYPPDITVSENNL
jgi:hypothetical protein